MQHLNNVTRTLATTLLLAFISACGGITYHPPEESEQTPEPFDFQPLLDKAISDEVTGMTLIVESPEGYFLGSAGVTDIDTREDMPVDAVMPAGSAGKSFVAVLALQLQEEGYLDLDDTIDTWLESTIVERIENGELITLRQLLNHTAGVYEYLWNEQFVLDVLNQPDVMRLDRDLLQYMLDKPASFPPGEGYLYSNSGYVLAGVILDKVLGYHHSIALRERILTPLGMDHTFYLGIENDRGEIISGYRPLSDLGITDDDTARNIKPYLYNVGVGDAPIATNVEDYLKYFNALIKNKDLLSEEASEQMFGDSGLVGLPGESFFLEGSLLSYGLGMFKETKPGVTLYHHGGDQFGWLTHNLVWEEKDLTLVLMTNCASDACSEAAGEVIQSILEQ